MFSEAREVISYMIQHNLSPMELTCRRVVDSYCKARRYEDARDFLSEISETDWNFDKKVLQTLTAHVDDAQFRR
jgi:pentatricopeptide repeat domain-containing protein 1